MSSEALRDVLTAGVRTLAGDRLLFFVGSGLSRTAGYPTWREAIQEAAALASALLTDPQQRDLVRLLSTQMKPPAFFQSLRELLTPSDYLGLIVQAFSGRGDRKSVALQKELLRARWGAIVTTNYDSLLEDAYAQVVGRHALVALNDDRGIARVASAQDPVIFKIHGCFTTPSSMVVKTSDYEKLYQNDFFRRELHRLLRDFQVVFLGYGLREQQVRDEWDAIRELTGGAREPGVLFAHGAYLSADEARQLVASDVRVFTVPAPEDDWSFVSDLIRLIRERYPAAATSVAGVGVPSISLDERRLAEFLVLRLSAEERDARQQFLLGCAVAGLIALRNESFHTIDSVLLAVGRGVLPRSPAIREGLQLALDRLAVLGVVEKSEGGYRLSADGEHEVHDQQRKFDRALRSAARAAARSAATTVDSSAGGLDEECVLRMAARLLQREAEAIALSIMRYAPVDSELQRLQQHVVDAIEQENVTAPESVVRESLIRFFSPVSEDARAAVERFVFSHLAAASFLIDPETDRTAREFARQHTLLLDASILLPLLAEHHPRHRQYAQLLTRCSKLGMALHVTQDILDEVTHNLDNALRYVRDISDRGINVADALAAYEVAVDAVEHNPFLLGFARCTREKKCKWIDYVGGLVEGSPSRASPRLILDGLRNWSVEFLRARDRDAEFTQAVDEVYRRILELRRYRRGLPLEIHEKLSRSEARQVVLVHSLRRASGSRYPVVWFLTTDRTLPRVQLSLADKYPIPLTFGPLALSGYLSLVDTADAVVGGLAVSLGRLAASGLADAVARRAVIALADMRQKLKATGSVTVVDMARIALDESHRKRIDEELEGISVRNLRGEDFNAAVDRSVTSMVEDSTRRLVLTQESTLRELKDTKQSAKQLRYKVRQLKRLLEERKSRRPRRSRRRRRRKK